MIEKKDYYNQIFDDYYGYKLFSAERNMYGALLLTFEDESGTHWKVTINATPLGGLNLRKE